ncbi:ArnT family glycosyltransferase [Lewinella sp. IMCC34191]|uniref:ArnT family glycosyltransferase n=1 Tax=Lewinella sp. IMCC34191 TaxID=2259172 RepID=UPI000E27787A|nr:phospholipid carrier-dependent glycosyltransferase [Lewinella sp. IMCC34191]
MPHLQKPDGTTLALWAIPIALIMALMIGPILRDGMFIDGLAYTNAARNMSQGLGRFWAPTIDGGGSVFYGHPPLLLYLESLYFRVFGDHLYTEDLYNFSVLALTLGLMYLIWRELAGRKNAALFFFPLLLFALNQETQLRYPNTLLECGMTLLLLSATYAYFRWERNAVYPALISVGVGAFLAVLAKGPVGLFILALPWLHRLIVDWRWSWPALLVPVFTTGAAFGLLFLAEPDALLFFREYLDRQVITALTGQATENVADSRLSIFASLIKANLPGVIACALLLLLPRRRDERAQAYGSLLLLLGFCAVLPIAVSPKQAAYYQLPALPFHFLGAALLLRSQLTALVAYIKRKRRLDTGLRIVGFTGLLGATIFALSLYGTVDRRDRTAWKQAEAIDAILDSLDTETYTFYVAGVAPDKVSSLSYPLTGTLNRLYGIQRDRRAETGITLWLSERGIPLPDPGDAEVLYLDEGVRLTKRPGKN